MNTSDIEKFNNAMRVTGGECDITHDESGKCVLRIWGRTGEILRVPNGVQIITGHRRNPANKGEIEEDEEQERNIDVRSVYIPDSVDTIWGAFSDAGQLENVEGANNVKIIGIQAFRRCIKLKSISMPNVTCILEKAFSGCKSLEKIDFPKIEKVNRYAVFECSNLRVFTGKPKNVEQLAFTNCESIELLDLSKCLHVENVAFGIYCKEMIIDTIKTVEMYKGTNIGYFGKYCNNVLIKINKASEIVVGQGYKSRRLQFMQEQVVEIRVYGKNSIRTKIVVKPGIVYSADSLIDEAYKSADCI